MSDLLCDETKSRKRRRSNDHQLIVVFRKYFHFFVSLGIFDSSAFLLLLTQVCTYKKRLLEAVDYAN